MDKQGNVGLATEPTLVNMQGGETVVNNADTKKALNSNGSSPVFDQEAYQKLIDYWNNPDNCKLIINSAESPLVSSQLADNVMANYNPMANMKFNVPDYSNLVQTRNQETTIHQDINVTIPNLDGETAFHKFENELNQMKLNALQRSYKK